jgi:hypothetical protein
MRQPQGGQGQQRMPPGMNVREGSFGPPRPLWYIDSGGKVDVIMVETGISDGSRTAIRPRPGDESPEGMQIIMRERVLR